MNKQILDFWNAQADEFGTSHWSSWGDNWVIDLEIQNIGQYINEGDKVLDVGCANGFSAIHHLGRGVESITGVDFSEPMIREAKNNLEQSNAKDKLHFEYGDVTKLQFEDNTFDVVYTTRVIINLPTWEEQLQGIKECIRVCKPGGTVIFSEGFWEPLTKLNAVRTLVGLDPLVEHDFNRYIKKSRIEAFFNEEGYDFISNDFSSVYYLGSRMVRELITKIEDYPGFTNPINEIFYNVEKDFSGLNHNVSGGGLGIQQSYMIKKL